MTLDLNAKRIYVVIEHSTAIFAFFCIFWAGEKVFEKFLKNPLTAVYTHAIIRIVSRATALENQTNKEKEKTKMTDLREYKEIIKKAVEQERRCDANWSWSIKAINKSEIKIGWGYLDYIGQKEPFSLKVEENPEDGMVEGVYGSLRTYILIGEGFWNDTPDLGKGIEMAIHSLAQTARCVYC